MTRNLNDPDARRPRKTIVWVVGGILIAILVIVALQGALRGGGEAVGVTESAPGSANPGTGMQPGGGHRKQ